MGFISSWFEVLLLWSLCSSVWSTEKCDVKERNSITRNSAQRQPEAQCDGVTDLKKDLAGLPTDLWSLQITYGTGVSLLLPNTFSAFHNLERLSISGCLTQILPAAFQGLRNLQMLTLKSCTGQDCFKTSIKSGTFSDLPKLESLQLTGYRISEIMPEVFSEIPQLKSLGIDYCCIQEVTDVICRVINVTSLRKLHIAEKNIQTLKYQNCSSLNMTVGKIPTFDSVSLDFWNISYIEKDALKYFRDVSSLVLTDSKLLSQLPLSGMKNVDDFSYHFAEVDFESICKTVSMFSVKSLFLTYYSISNYTDSTVKPCQGLNAMSVIASPGSGFSLDINFIHELKNLTKLVVSGNAVNASKFCLLCKLPGQVTWLTSLVLTSSKIYFIPARQFFCLVSLEYFALSNNLIDRIANYAFQGLVQLQFLILTQNKISFIATHVFSDLHNLKSLIIDQNPLKHIEENTFRNLASLQLLSIGHLQPQDSESTVKLNMTYIFNNIPRGLTNLTISSGRWPIHVIIGSNSKPKARLGFHITGKVVSFDDCKRPFFESIINVYAETDQLLCGSQFMGKYFPFVEDFEYVSSLTANFLDLTELNSLVHLRRLVICKVDFNLQHNLDVMFHNLSKLEILTLFDCRIDSLEGGLTRDLRSLTVVFLKISNTFSIMESFTEHSKHLKYLYIYQSKLYCHCDNAWLILWAKQQRQTEVIMGPSKENMSCEGEHSNLNFVKYVEDNCTTEVEFVLFLSTALGLVFFILVVMVHSLASAYLIALFHIARGWLDEALHPRAGRHYRFDAFVSYCGKDERWVFEELLPNLEERGPPFLRLCLHNRDFQLGKDIVDNITDSLYSSRRTLCLVSQNYLHSNWCSLELKLATHRLLVERKDVLILIFLEKISPFQLSAHHRLARLVKTRTYLDWPQDPNQRAVFWDRLRAKLVPTSGGA
ncbi:toll-like receptor 12 [Anguilla anguilla]|uniref:toll-like receptor 12 n=1 Tax=Anguilla anguilla TaxID=7936 RepID=UPI0015B166E3|nr:toll-like receptor 12 [Anguilla anguilla]